MSTSRIESSDLRSLRARSQQGRMGPAGFHHNPQDFSKLSGTKYASRQTLHNKNWHYLPENLRAKIDSLSTTFHGVPIDAKGQMGLALN